MKKVLFLGLLVGTCFQGSAQSAAGSSSSTSSANGAGVKSYEGTMRDNLPVPTNAAKKTEIFYPRPGEVSFSTQVWCGDGDVANYYSAHPNEVYNKGASTQRLAMGYWVTTGSQKIPDINSWFLMGYADIPSTKGFLNELSLANSKTKVQASTIIKEELKKLENQFSVLDTSRDQKEFNVYAGVMLCNSYQDSSGINNSKDSPTAATIAASLVDYFKNKSQKDSAELLNGKVAKASFSATGGLLNIQFVGGSSSNIYDTALKKIMSLDCKDICGDSTKTMGDYRDYLNKDKLLDNLASLASSCQTQIKKGTPQYWWESVSMALDCNEIGQSKFSEAVTSLKGNDKSAMDSALSLDDFNKIKSDIKNYLSRAALVKQVQDSVDGLNLSKNKGRCFPVGRPYIETVIASLPYSFSQKTLESGTVSASIQGSKGEMSLPEPNYALGAAAQYYNNERAVFMSAGDPLVIDITKGLPVITFGSGVSFPMRVRDVGCSNGPGYCILKDGNHFFERLN